MRKFCYFMLAAFIACPATALAQAGESPKAATLAASLRVSMAKAEQQAAAAFFPRKNILAAVSRSMWETFYHGDYSSAEEAAAVDAVAADASTPIIKEAATRMKYELQLD